MNNPPATTPTSAPMRPPSVDEAVGELGQVEREAAAWEKFEDAVRRDDKDEASRAWKIFARIHAQRPEAMVERLERAKGLR